MKANIHPQYFPNAQVVCACGNTFTIGSTQQSIHVELCSKCHPFYTGEQKFVDTANLIDKFKTRVKKAEEYKAHVVQKNEEKKARDNAPKTLAEMLAGLK